jgi:type I restriction enzyme S subunit
MPGSNSRGFTPQLTRDRLLGVQTGTAVPHISASQISEFRFCLPSIAEQRAIAHILGTLDDKIVLNRQMNQTLDEIARTLFTSWFVNFDPVRAKMAGRQPDGMDAATAALFPDRLVDSALGPIPEGWEVRSLDEIGSFLNGLALQKYPPRGDDTDLPVIKIAQLRDNNTFSASTANSDVPSKYIVENGDFLFSWSGSLLATVWSGGRGALNQHLFKVTSHYPTWFIYHWVHEHIDHFRRIAADKATTMGHINRHHLSAAMCAVPTNRTIHELGNRSIGELIALALTNSLESRTLAELRTMLLPELLSGRLLAPGSDEVES